MPLTPSNEQFLSLIRLEAERLTRITDIPSAWGDNYMLLDRKLSHFEEHLFSGPVHREDVEALNNLVQLAALAMRAAQGLKLT